MGKRDGKPGKAGSAKDHASGGLKSKVKLRLPAEQTSRLFAALSAPLRLQILEVLSYGESSVSDLVKALSAEQPNISRHLSILLSVGLVRARREGLRRIYTVAGPHVTALVELAGRLNGQSSGGGGSQAG